MSKDVDEDPDIELRDLEKELYGLQPFAVPKGYCERVIAQLEAGDGYSPIADDPFPRCRLALGFMPAAAAVIVAAAVVWVMQPDGAGVGSNPAQPEMAAIQGDSPRLASSGVVTSGLAGIDPEPIPLDQFERVSLGDSLRDAQPEGYHYENGQVYRQVRYRYDKVVVLKHPEDGTLIRVSVPQEEVHLERVETN